MVQWLRIHLPMQEIQVLSLGRENPLEKETVTQSSLLVWEIPWTEEPGRLQSMESQIVGHDGGIEQTTIAMVNFSNFLTLRLCLGRLNLMDSFLII